MNNFLNFNVTRNFLNNFNNFLDDNLIVDDLLFVFWNFYKLVNDSLNNFFNFNVYVLWNLYFDNFVLNHWDLNNSFDFLYFLFNNDLRNDSLNNLRNFYYFLNDSWYNNNFFYNPFYFNDLRNFNHLFDNFLDWNFDFFNSVNIFDDLNYFLFDVFNWLWNINIMIDDSFNFNCLGLFNNDWISQVNFFYNSIFYSLNNWFFDYLLHCDKSFMNYWNFYYSFNFSWDFSNDFNWNSDFLHNL